MSGLVSRTAFDFGAEPRRVGIVRALCGLGDFLCIVPTLRALRATWPQSCFTLIGVASARRLVDRFGHYLDEFLEFPGFPGIPERRYEASQLVRFLSALETQPFEVAFQMHGSGTVSNLFTGLLGAPLSAGFHIAGQYCPNAEYFPPYPEHLPEVRRWLHLVDRLGFPLCGEQLEFPITRDERRSCFALMAEFGLLRMPFVCIHPGASTPARRWPVERFAKLADVLQRRGLQAVLTGTACEGEIGAAVAGAMETPAVNLVGRLPLGEAACLLQSARLLVTNDTGLSHLAAATRTPSVVIFTASDPVRWAPLDTIRHRPVHPSAAGPVRQSPVAEPTADGCQQAAPPDRVVPSVADALREVDRLLAADLAQTGKSGS